MWSKDKLTNYLLLAGIGAILTQVFVVIWFGQARHFNWLGSQPISDLGITKAFVTYSVGFAIGALFLILFTIGLRLKYASSKWFVVIFSIGIASEFVTGIVPDQPTKLNPLSSLWLLHWVAASALLISIPLSMRLFVQAANLTASAKTTLNRIFMLYVILLVPEAFLMGFHILYALSEATSLLIFDSWVLYTIFAKTTPYSREVPTKYFQPDL